MEWGVAAHVWFNQEGALSKRFSWGHININVSDLERSMVFYEQLGFSVLLPGIPYLGLRIDQSCALEASAAAALGLPAGTMGRACIMQLDNGFPKLDLTELAHPSPQAPLANQDLGLVRFCLASQNLQADYEHLLAVGVEFLSPPTSCGERLADVAVCKDPDGTLIELIQIYLERWQLPE